LPNWATVPIMLVGWHDAIGQLADAGMIVEPWRYPRAGADGPRCQAADQVEQLLLAPARFQRYDA
jgi:hypothetical protein